MAAAPIWGSLRVVLRRAENLPNVEWAGQKQDPYCELRVGDLAPKLSRVIEDGGINPDFKDQTFTFEPVLSNQSLHIKLRDKNLITKDKDIGNCNQQISEIVGYSYPVELALRVHRVNKIGTKGTLLIKAQFVPINGHTGVQPPGYTPSQPQPQLQPPFTSIPQHGLPYMVSLPSQPPYQAQPQVAPYIQDTPAPYNQLPQQQPYLHDQPVPAYMSARQPYAQEPQPVYVSGRPNGVPVPDPSLPGAGPASGPYSRSSSGMMRSPSVNSATGVPRSPSGHYGAAMAPNFNPATMNGAYNGGQPMNGTAHLNGDSYVNGHGGDLATQSRATSFAPGAANGRLQEPADVSQPWASMPPSANNGAVPGQSLQRAPVLGAHSIAKPPIPAAPRLTGITLGKSTRATAAAEPAPPSVQWILPPDCQDRDGRYNYIIGEEKQGFVRGGRAHNAINKNTQQPCVIRIFSKQKMDERMQQSAAQEVKVLRALKGHANVVQMLDAWETPDELCIVTELCRGGELYDSLAAFGAYCEAHIAKVMRSLMQILSDLHEQGIAHLNLQPTSILLSDDFDKFLTEDAVIQLSGWSNALLLEPDFGNAKIFAKDLWSCGALMYQLLSGRLPYESFLEDESASRDQPVDITSDPWPAVPEASELVQRLLDPNPETRLTAIEFLEQPWASEEGGPTSNVPIVLEGLRKFGNMSKFVKLAVKIIADHLPKEEIDYLRQQFDDMDQDGSNSISPDEFISALQSQGQMASRSDVEFMLAAADLDGDSELGFQEFVAVWVAVALNQGAIADETLALAFKFFDQDGDGAISRRELITVLYDQGMGMEDVGRIMGKVDEDGDGRIDLEEFKNMLYSI